MSLNVFGDSGNIGPILDNVKNTVVGAESLLTINVDDTITPVPISAYGKSILNETSVSSLRNKILDADTAIEITDNGVGEINFEVDDALKMQITDADTKIKNNLLVDNIKDEAGGNAITLLPGEVRFKKPVYIEWPNKKFSIQGGATDNVIYEKGGLNLGFNISYNPSDEDETVTAISLNTSKVLINNAGIALQTSDTINNLPTNVLVASNSAITCSKDLKTNVIKSNASTLDLYADTHSLKNNAGTNKLTITSSTDTTHIDTANTHIKGNIFPSFNGGGNLGVGLNDANTKRYNNLYLYNSLDINGNSGAGDSAVILRDDSIADNTIRDNTYCTNMILGTMDAANTSALGRGFLRLGAGYNNPNIIETYIDLYGANSTGTFQQIKHRINDAYIFTLTSVNAEFHTNLISRTIYPESDIAYDLGVSGDNEWRNVYTENISVGGQFHHSDKRIKDNIIDLPNDKGLEFIQSLRPVQYTYIKSTQKRKHWGFIAQEIREAVGSDDYSIWGEQKTKFKKQHIAPSEFLGPIVKSIQELNFKYEVLSQPPANHPVLIRQNAMPNATDAPNRGSVDAVQMEKRCSALQNELCLMQNMFADCTNGVITLQNTVKEQSTKIELLENRLEHCISEKTSTNDFGLTDDDSPSIFDLFEKRMNDLELRLAKSEAKNKKMTTIINRLAKTAQ